ncbi:uncharacterized protein ACWYII_040992 isoform 1-T1 [Salvelinus alpinus]
MERLVDCQVNLQMDKQADRHIDTKVFLPGPLSPAAPWFRCVVALVSVMGLVIMALLVGFCIGFYTQRATQGTGQAICTEKFNKTFILQEGKPSEEETDEFDYDIFIAPKDAIYFIHGQVTMADGKGKVYLFWKLKSSRKIKTNNGTCPEITFATEVKLLKGGRVYLVFNVGKPNLKESTFSVYELAEQ